MAEFKVLNKCRDKETGEVFEKGKVVDKTVKYITDFENRLKEAGYDQKFFKRNMKVKGDVKNVK
ncbi:hypothetical protein RSA37_11880 [Mammaliicoccus sciuri]|uniref:hypothetical protein n=1 Tax=Mammaliicoccus sciuri TaxID=1296 RepID=UPI000733CEB3|nr:hypothetical protein [Mammaliicoccus sciuri]KTT82728.1 hypothetical protein NS1R_12140 [Mammaliicoccus sciuri]KTT88215.1 hypothetical protein NS112_09350 [Mammaliicoccus sciuri]KTT89758.1 hypothetical protein NS36R_07875 [Mammaliicoccus sciuri]KTT94150.1 hypothetical protein NS44R_08290 [Mammaliicoccus sciuri]KTW10744.1 hypothetical protein RSA37_11880 [Mammaliicoccus sciuri]